MKKNYAKVRERELGVKPAETPEGTSTLPKQATTDVDTATESSDLNGQDQRHRHRNSIEETEGNETHSVVRSNTPSNQQEAQDGTTHSPDDAGAMHPDRRRMNRRKPHPFKKELEQAEKKRGEREAARKAKEEALQERQKRLEERERWRKAMAKARKPGKNGQRKLGRESKVLLEKIQRLVG